MQNEGLDLAERFNADRTTVFVLTYRLPAEGLGGRSLAPLQDAQRAMRMIRARASDFRIDPARLGIIGFSAGGHLAADLAVSFDQGVYRPVDAADCLSARPAFAGLIYPVTTLGAETHGGSRDNLFGPNAPAELIAARSPVLHVTGSTPPSFVVAAFDDGTVPIDNSLQWIDAVPPCKDQRRSASARRGRPWLRLPPAERQSRFPLARPLRTLDAPARRVGLVPVRLVGRAVAPMLQRTQLIIEASPLLLWLGTVWKHELASVAEV